MAAGDRTAACLAFFAAWGRSFGEACEAFETLLDPDVVWDQRPIPRIHGSRRAVGFLGLARTLMGMETIDVEIRAVAEAGDTVMVERVDRLRRRDGSLIVAAPVTGVLTFDGDRVVHWREYFDLGGFALRSLGSTAFHLARTGLRTAAGAAVQPTQKTMNRTAESW